MSHVKLGLLIFWPTFWTGFPVKLAIVLILLAAHMHPWEGSGLFILLLLSIPIDIWALSLCARTVFIDRLKIDPPPNLGPNLWMRWAVFSAVALPVIKLVVSAAAGGTKAAVASLMESVKENFYPTFPVAEQISLELVMWGSVASIILIFSLVGWLYGLGWLAQPFVQHARPLSGTRDDQTRYWDNLRIPADQPLLLTAFTGAGVVLVFLFWGLMPPTTPHPHEEYEYTFEKKEEVVIEPKKVLQEAEQVLTKAELVIKKLKEEKNENTAKPVEKMKITIEAKQKK